MDILDEITEEDKHCVLETLIKQNCKFSKTIERIVRKRMADVDRETIAQEVENCLDGLDYDEFLERLEQTPETEALSDHYQKLRQLQQFGMWSAATDLCQGILLGTFRHVQGEESDFDRACPGTPDLRFLRLCDDWRNNVRMLLSWRSLKASIPNCLGIMRVGSSGV